MAALTISAGCATAAHRSKLLQQSPEISGDERQMRSALYEYTYRFSRSVELAAKRIAAESGDPVIGPRAMYWRFAATSEIQRAAFRQDVLIAMVDAWTLLLQQRDFFTSGAGKEAFGAAQPIVVELSADLLQAFIETAEPFATDKGMQNGSNYAGQWALKHPIQDISFARRSIAPLFAERLAEAGSEHGPTQSLANLEASIEDLLQRMNVYADQFPRQAVAQSELLVDAFLEKPRLVRSFAMLDAMRDDMGSMTSVVAGLPDLVRAERVAAFESVANERTLMLEALTKERLAMQELLQQERAHVMGDADKMLQETLKTLVAERQAAMKELPAAAAASLAVNQRTLEGLIDRMIWGFASLIGAAGAALMLLLILAKRFGFFASQPAGDSMLPEAPKVVAKT